MSKAHKAIPAKPNQILSFPSQDKPVHWRARFEHAHDQGKAYLLTFPFTGIKEKQAMLVLYDAVPKPLKDYPGVVDKFFHDAGIAVKVAEESIEDDRQKKAPGNPGALIQFRSGNLEKINAR